MDWHQIKKQYPYCWDSLKEYVTVNKEALRYKKLNNMLDIMVVSLTSGLAARGLYDFFDGHDIFCRAEVYHYSQEVYHYQSGVLVTYQLNSDEWGQLGMFNTRTEAETAAFTKAFEILESKLSIVAKAA